MTPPPTSSRLTRSAASRTPTSPKRCSACRASRWRSDSRLDTFWEGRRQLDFTASYDVTDRLGVFFEAKNLTNTEGVRYVGDRSRVIEREAFGYTLFGGLRFDF
jgi:outer membrane receptor protein involved in Fe transport